jgi:hypothetical protein
MKPANREDLFRDFVALPSNRTAAQALARWSLGRPAAPLLLVGPSGVGKSHLVREAALLRLGVKSRRRITIWTAADLAYGFVEAVLRKAIARFEQGVCSRTDLIILEHLEDVRGRPETRKMLFQLARKRARVPWLLTFSGTPRSARDTIAVFRKTLRGTVAFVARPTALEIARLGRVFSVRRGMAWGHVEQLCAGAGSAVELVQALEHRTCNRRT